MSVPKLFPVIFGIIAAFFSTISWASYSPVYSIEVLKNGSLLLATAKGIERQDVTTVSLQNNLFQLGMTERLVRVVKRWDEGLFLATNNGLYIKVKDTIEHHLKGLMIFDLVRKSPQAIIVATSGGVLEFNRINNETVWLKKNLAVKKLALFDNQLIIGTKTGLHIINMRQKSSEHYLQGHYIYDIVSDGSQVIILSDPYTYRLTESGQLQRLDSDNDPLFNRGVLNVSRNIIWLASQEGNLHARTLDTFTPINHTLNRSPQKILTLAMDSLGNLFVGTKKGLEQYNPPIIRTLPQTQGVNHSVGAQGHEFLCADDSIKRNGQLIAEASSLLKGNRIMVCHVQNGALYIGTYKGLLRFDESKNQLEKITLPLSHTSILSLAQGTQADSLFLGTLRDGLVEITEQGEKIKHYGSGYNRAGIVANNGDVFTVEEKQLLAITPSGTVSKIDLSNVLFSDVSDMTFQGNFIYLATYGDGVLEINLKTGTINQFDESSNLPNNITTSITTDPQGNIWVGTFSGLAVFDGQRFTPVGAPIEYSLGGLEVLADGSIRTGSEQGIQVWNTQEVMTYLAQNPRPFISQLQVGEDTIFDPQYINLDYDSEPVQLRAMVANLLSSGLSMEYKIEGHDATWRSLGREALFSLPRDIYGDYVLLLRIKGRPQSQMTYNLAISTPWYLNPLHILGALFGFLSMGHQGARRYVLSKKELYQGYLQQVAQALGQVAQERTDNRIIFAKVLSGGIAESMAQVIAKMPEVEATPSSAKADLQSLHSHVGTLEQLYYPVILAHKGLYAALKEDVALRQRMGYEVRVTRTSLSAIDYLNARQRLTVYLGVIELVEKFNELQQPLSIRISSSQFMTVVSLPVANAALDSWLQFSWSPKLWGVTYDIAVTNENLAIRIIPASS